MLTSIAHVLFFLTVPLLGLWLEKRHRFFELFNPVVFSYAAGLLLANSPLVAVDTETATTVTEAAIPLAIPLILFSSHLGAWLSQGRGAILSFVAATASVMTTATLACFLFGESVEEASKISGMLVGTYTGGTPNLLGIGMALEAKEETFVLLNAADVVLGALYLLVLISVAKPLLRRVLPAFRATGDAQIEDSQALDLRSAAPHMALALLVSVVIVAASAGLTIAVAGKLAVPGIFLGLTTGGILASLVPAIRRLRGSYELGNYFILVFCVAMGARSDLSELLSSGSTIFAYAAFVMIGAIVLHFLLAALLRIDVDTAIITSTAAVFGPAFVPVIAEAIDNRRVILSGLTAGLIGYAVGNYLGIALGYALS